MSASMAEVLARAFYNLGWEAETSEIEHVDEVLAANGYGKLEDAWDACNAADTPWINPYRRPE